jgi:type II secretory pathway component PulJ
MTHTRRGASLAELLVVMSACSVVLSLSSQILCRVMRTQIDSRAVEDVERSAARLSERFRADVHQAATAETAADTLSEGVFLRLALPAGRQVEYSRQAQCVLRRESGGGSPEWREEFQLPAACHVSIREENTPLRFVLTASTRPDEVSAAGEKPVAATTSLYLQVEGRLGRDRRFAQDRAQREVTR